MSSLSAKDRVSLCSFTFSDGRRCRTPRVRNHPHFCFYHAQKEARAQAADTLGKDLSYFFSGNYLSGCDLSTALARLIPAVVRGDVKSKTAHTVAYLMQTLLQAIHISQHEYSASQPAPSPHTSLPPTSAEFVQHVVAGLQTDGGQAPQPTQGTQSAPAQTPANCHSEQGEESAFSQLEPGDSPLATHLTLPQATAPPSTPRQPVPVAPPFRSGALPLPVRRRLHRAGKPV
jgi:hypothetical protein